VGTRRQKVNAQRFGKGANSLDKTGEVRDRVPGTAMRCADDLDRVGEQLVCHVREPVGSTEPSEQGRGRRSKFAAVAIDARNFPFDPKSRSLRSHEIDIHEPILPTFGLSPPSLAHITRVQVPLPASECEFGRRDDLPALLIVISQYLLLAPN